VLQGTVGDQAQFLKDRQVRQTAKRLKRDVIWSELPPILGATPALATASETNNADEVPTDFATLGTSYNLEPVNPEPQEPLEEVSPRSRRSSGYIEAAE